MGTSRGISVVLAVRNSRFLASLGTTNFGGGSPLHEERRGFL
jgi:hypothetical protein